MKNTLIRLLTVMTLATSVSAFAATSSSCPESSIATQQASQQQSKDKAIKTQDQKKSKKSQDEDSAQKEFDRALLGIYG
jgi:hypothetical protein